MDEFLFDAFRTDADRSAYERRRRLGVSHGGRLAPLAPGPADEPHVTVTTSVPQTIERVVCRVSAPSPAEFELQPEESRWDVLNWQYGQRWRGRLPARPKGTLVRYTIQAHPQDGGAPIAADEGTTFSYLVGDPQPPAWSREAIIYQIFPDRFHPGRGRAWNQVQYVTDIYGGTLRGIVENLDYVADLGFNCIWLNPFFPDESHHGYHASDYFSVNPRLGDEADLHLLVEQAHARGIRLLLDFVANHWGSQHPTFRHARAQPDSEYYHWYHWRNWPDDYATYRDVRALPKINVGHPAARKHLLDAAVYWLEEFDFDGFRLDHANGPGLDFWSDFRVAVQAARPDVWLFGEVVEPAPEQRTYWGRLHGCLDFLLEQALRDTFGRGVMDLEAFDAFLMRHERFFPTGFSRPSFLDNHDVDRFLWLAQGDQRKLRLAALVQFTLSGPPIVYYGTEVGVSQKEAVHPLHGPGELARAREPMRWDVEQDRELLNYYRQLIHFRRTHPVLWQGQRTTVHLDAQAGTYAYTRSGDAESVLVVVNASPKERSVTVAGRSFDLEPWSGAWHVFE
ncbi:MAG: alpha-amylase family glycosyl hydrolase [Candidatus Promineifilaceae bacterium]|nr:alpha-amylase family glycosyl hydrolase [Candidatus Promineifilaceae bacterium]